MSNDKTAKAAEARDGFFHSVTGKAKEVAGAVSGRDRLVEEGQLQQTEAHKRKDAAAKDALADSESDEAKQELRETTREAAKEEGIAHARVDRTPASIERSP